MRLTEEQVKKEIDDVAKFADNAEKLSWRRKLKKLEALVDDLQPYEDRILKIYQERMPIMDKIAKLRQVMSEECIHPKDQLVHKGTHIECKFCGNIIKPRR